MNNVREGFGMESLRQVLLGISGKPDLAWIYLPEDRNWSLDSVCVALESEEVPPELEDDPDAGVPDFARNNGLIQVLPVRSVQDIVENARAQKSDASVDDLFVAFVFYFKNDAFISF